MLIQMNSHHITNFITPASYVGMGDLFSLSNVTGIT
jgi:hypothetical protein